MRVAGGDDAQRAEGVHGPRRGWVAERTFAWLVKSRRLGKDYEFMTETVEAMIDAATTHRMLRWLHPADGF